MDTESNTDPDVGDDVKLQADSSPAQADSPAIPADSASSDQDAAHRDLVKQLTQSDVVETPEAVEEAEEVADVDDDPEEGIESAAPTEPQAESSDLSSVDTDKRIGERTRKRIDQLRGKAAFGDLVTETLVKAKITPDEFSRWTNLAARLKGGDKAAVDELIATARAFGYVEPVAEAKAAPSHDDLADKIYADEFESDVANLAITEDVARKYAKKIAQERTKAQPEARPVQRQPEQRADPIRERALGMINDLEQDYSTKVKDFGVMQKRINERLVKEYGNTDPIAWVGGYQDIVRDEIRKSAPPAAKKAEPLKPVADRQIRPVSSGQHTPVKDEGDSHSQMVRDLMAGKYAPARR